MKDWLNEWYNDQFNKIDLTPSSKVWDNIAQSMEDWPKHWYASNASDIRTEPRQSTWNQINEQLARQRAIQRANRVPYLAASIIVAILLVIPFKTDDTLLLDKTPFSSQNFNVENVTFDSNSRNIAQNEITEETISGPQLSQLEEDTKEITIQRNDGLVYGQSRTSSIVPLPNIYKGGFEWTDFAEEKNALRAMQYDVDKIMLAQQPVYSLSNRSVKGDEIVIPDSDDFVKNQLSASVLPQISMLNNPLTQSAISSDDESLSINPELAFQVAYQRNFNARSGLKIAMLFNNKKTLRTKANGSDRTISLNYNSLGMLYTTQWDFLRSERVSFRTEAGLIAGIAADPEVRFNNERIENLESGFRNIDLGMIVGASLNTELSPRWTLTTGVQSQVGMINIFKGNQFVPQDFFSTSTQSVGFNFGLIYNL